MLSVGVDNEPPEAVVKEQQEDVVTAQFGAEACNDVPQIQENPDEERQQQLLLVTEGRQQGTDAGGHAK